MDNRRCRYDNGDQTMTWTIKAESGEERTVDSRAEAESVRNDMEQLGMNCEITAPDETKTDGGQADSESPRVVPDGEILPHDYDEPNHPEQTESDDGDGAGKATTNIPENPDIDKNPVEWLPDHLIDMVEGVPTISRKGYCIVCQQYGVSIESESIVRSSDTEFEYAEFRAVAVDSDGKAYSGFGTAHVERGDDPYLLNELAETRAMKRAATWATGVGLTAVEEME
jgi:hypothetical protein